MLRLRYTLETTFSAVREAPGLSLLTILTIGAALVVLGGYVAGLQNLEKLALTWGRAATISAYLDDGLAPEHWDAIRDTVADLDAVESARLLSPARALAEFRAQGPETAALVEGIEPGILPASVEVDLRPAFADLSDVERVSGAIRTIDGVAEVDYGREEFDRLQALLELLRIVGLVVGLFVVAATAFIISNTIRLTVFSRRDEIRILSLVGATRWFIRAPFLLEGAIWGLGGGVVAAGTLLLADLLLAPRISNAVAEVLGGLEVSFFSPLIGLSVAATGVVLGVLGSSLAVTRFLLDEEAA